MTAQGLLRVGDRAPAFTLADQEGRRRELAEASGKWVLLYFYPKDFTPGCTTEACTMRDAWNELQAAGVTVFGVSADSVQSHQRFAAKYHLPFPLLADPEKTVIRAYGAWGTKKFMGRTFEGIKRMSFLIDPQGKIATVYPAVKPDRHAAEVIEDLRALAAKT